MSRSPILFRCDGVPELGWESFYQCLTLALSMQRRRRGTHFFSRLDPTSLAGLIVRGGHEVAAADHPIGSEDDARQTIRRIRQLDAAAVVVAGSNITADYIDELMTTGVLVILVDSDARFPIRNKLVLNPFLAPGLRAYHAAPGTQILLGRRYPLVRGLFRRQRSARGAEPNQPFRCLIAMGDDDPLNESMRRAEEALETPKVEKVSVVVRPHHPHLEELQAFAKDQTPRLEILTETGEISTRVARSHFALTAGDNFSLELACVGIPQLILPQTQRHLRNALALDEEGAATFLGEASKVRVGDLRAAINIVLSDPLERLGMSRCARQLIDGRGPDRIVNAVEIMLHPAKKVQPLRIAA